MLANALHLLFVIGHFYTIQNRQQDAVNNEIYVTANRRREVGIRCCIKAKMALHFG